MDKPICSQKSPYVLKGEKKKYAWCSCGKSAKQPFCDGSHKGTDFSPIIVDNLKESNINYIEANTLEDAANKAVAALTK